MLVSDTGPQRPLRKYFSVLFFRKIFTTRAVTVDRNPIHTFSFDISLFFQTGEISANCYLANGWTCFIKHKVLHPSLSIVESIMVKAFIGGSGGGRAGCMPPPMGPNSFIFAYIFTKKHPHQRSMPPPPNGCTPPSTGNPGSATGIGFISWRSVVQIRMTPLV